MSRTEAVIQIEVDPETLQYIDETRGDAGVYYGDEMIQFGIGGSTYVRFYSGDIEAIKDD